MIRLLVLATLVLCASCATEVDTAGLPSISDYKTWTEYTAVGPAPGHSDTYRLIYVNDTARRYTGFGEYLDGSAVVKEIFELVDGDQPGELLYVSIMRKLPKDQTMVDESLVKSRWILTDAAEVGEPEQHRAFCWDRCHIQAPFDGTFYNYGE